MTLNSTAIKLSGFSPIITAVSLMHTDFLKSISATTVLDRNSSSEYLAAEMKKITNLPIRFLFDTISIDSTQKTGLDLLVPGGQMVIVLPPLVKADKKVIFHAFASISLPYNMEPICGPLYHEKPSRLVERGIIKVRGLR